MKKLYKDIRFTKGILTLTAGLLIAGCSAEDELKQLACTTAEHDSYGQRPAEVKSK